MISPDEYNAFVVEWYSGHYPWQRFGQAFINKFAAMDAPTPTSTSLFYEESTVKAKERAWREYVDACGSNSQGM